jgi:hypothetical protein
MSTNAREALRHLTAALETHLDAVLARRSAEDAAVDDAFDAVAEAFERYEDVLDSALGESLPLVLDDDDSFDESDDDVDDDVDESDDDDEDAETAGIDVHAVGNDDEMDDDIEEFDLR